MNISASRRVSIEQFLARLESDPYHPLDDETIEGLLDDVQGAEYKLGLVKQITAQKAEYDAAFKPGLPTSVGLYLSRLNLYLQEYDGRLSRMKTVEREMTKLALRLESHQAFFRASEDIWADYDALSNEEKWWLSEPITKSDRSDHNMPKVSTEPPLRAVLPDQIPARTAVQLKMLSRLLND